MATTTSRFTLAQAAREYVWLYDRRHGISAREIAAREGLRLAEVDAGIARAEAADAGDTQTRERWPAFEAAHAPSLVPLFPIGPYTPQSACPHNGPIPPGSLLYCEVCGQSGMDAHPALRR